MIVCLHYLHSQIRSPMQLIIQAREKKKKVNGSRSKTFYDQEELYIYIYILINTFSNIVPVLAVINRNRIFD